MSAKGKEEYI